MKPSAAPAPAPITRKRRFVKPPESAVVTACARRETVIDVVFELPRASEATTVIVVGVPTATSTLAEKDPPELTTAGTPFTVTLAPPSVVPWTTVKLPSIWAPSAGEETASAGGVVSRVTEAVCGAPRFPARSRHGVGRVLGALT